MNKIVKHAGGRPTKRQRRAFENIERGMSKRQAMLKAGYSLKTSGNPKEKLVESKGYQQLVKEYRGYLINNGITLDVLSEVQAEGLFDQDARVRLDYLRENKKDFGLVQEQTAQNLTQVNIELPDWAK